jgi:hypothetical protein
VAALVRKWRAGSRPEPGARSAIGALDLTDYEQWFSAYGIVTGERATSPVDAPLYQQILGPAWTWLPAAVRAMHQLRGGAILAEGRARVERGRNPLARLIAWACGFPGSADDVSVSVRLSEQGGVELWERSFAGQRFSSRQKAGTGRDEALLVESFGPLNFALAVVADASGLRLAVRRWHVFGLALPLWLAPATDAQEFVADGRFNFNVGISHRLVGMIVRYRGYLELVQA